MLSALSFTKSVCAIRDLTFCFSLWAMFSGSRSDILFFIATFVFGCDYSDRRKCAIWSGKWTKTSTNTSTGTSSALCTSATFWTKQVGSLSMSPNPLCFLSLITNTALPPGIEPSKLYHLVQFMVYDDDYNKSVSVDETMTFLFHRYGKQGMDRVSWKCKYNAFGNIGTHSNGNQEVSPMSHCKHKRK